MVLEASRLLPASKASWVMSNLDPMFINVTYAHIGRTFSSPCRPMHAAMKANSLSVRAVLHVNQSWVPHLHITQLFTVSPHAHVWYTPFRFAHLSG